MTNQNLVATIKKRLDDVEGADADTDSILNELRLASTKLASEPIIKATFFPEVSTAPIPATIVSGTDTYMLPTNFNYNIERVVIDPTSTSSILLQRVEPDRIYDLQQAQGSSLGYFAIRGNNIVLAGIPTSTDANKTIQIWYSKLPAEGDILNDSTETLLGKKYGSMLADAVCVKFLLTDPDLAPLADRYQKSYQDELERARQELESINYGSRFNMQTEDDDDDWGW